MIYTIYSITCLVNNKVYFGRSQEVEKRWRSHRNMLRASTHSNMHMQEDWDSYGEEFFAFKIVHETNILDDAIELEQTYIDSNDFTKYNITSAINGGDTFTNNPRSEQTRKLKSINSTGKNNPMYGVAKSDLMIQRVKEANSKKIYIGDVLYSSLADASLQTGINITTIHYRLNSNSLKFSKWQYA